MPQHIIIVSNTAWSVSNFRMGLIKALISKGCRVTAMAPPDGNEKKLPPVGCAFIPLKNLSQAGTSPYRDWQLYLEFKRLFKQEKPDAVLLYTPKPNVYGSMAAAKLGIRCINTINGLGYTFQNPGMLSTLMLQLYRMSLRKSHKVFFQNKDDLSFFLDEKILDEKKTHLVAGSGVDTDAIQPVAKSPQKKFVFLLCTRLIAEKGVPEYIQAAHDLHTQFPDAVFRLIGKIAIHPSAIDESVLKKHMADGTIEYIEEIDDINAALNDVDVLVHPSYYKEGIPRILLEGLSKGLPIITTDSVGCRDTVDNEINGLIIPPKNAEALADAMRRMLTADKSVLENMGKASRQKALDEFDERKVIAEYLHYLGIA